MHSTKLIFAILAFALTGAIVKTMFKATFQEALVGATLAGSVSILVMTALEGK